MLSSAVRSVGVCHSEDDVRLPTYEEIARDDEQLEVYETPFDESVFVVGPPGSGKTVLAIHRAQMLAFADIRVVLINYNRMLRRLIAQLTEQQIQARTMHQFVSACYRAQVNTLAPNTAPYVYDWNAMFATLERRGVTPNPTHVIVDEGQDLPKEFFRYLRNFVATAVTVFADEDQALSDKRSTPRDIKEAARLDDPVYFAPTIATRLRSRASPNSFTREMPPSPRCVARRRVNCPAWSCTARTVRRRV